MTERLLQSRHCVTGVDSLTDYYDPALKLRNLRRCQAFPGFHHLPCEVGALSREIVSDAEIIFHLAGQPGVRGSWGHDFQTYVTRNILETQHLLELAAACPPRRFVYASSSSIYGNSRALKVSEDSPKEPYSPYGVTKLAGEQLCSLYAANCGLSVVSLRFFTVFGPRQRPDMMFHKLIRAALTGEVLPLYGDGAMERDFTCVHDIVDALILAAETPTDEHVFNIAGGEVISLLEAIAMVEDLVGSKVKLEYREERRGDVRRTSADTSRAARQLRFCPKWTLRDGLRSQIVDAEEILRETTAFQV